MLEIRRAHKAGRTLKSLAAEYGVSPAGIRHVVTGWVWTHVSMEGLPILKPRIPSDSLPTPDEVPK